MFDFVFVPRDSAIQVNLMALAAPSVDFVYKQRPCLYKRGPCLYKQRPCL